MTKALFLFMHESTINVELELNVEVDYEICNDGIGHYEYGGAVGFDRGKDYASITSVRVTDIVTIDGVKYLKLTPDQIIAIDREIDRCTESFLDEISDDRP